ncbi:MAG: antitoxin [Deferrisomatales bacterium]
MASLSIRGFDEDEARLLKQAARKAGKSVNNQVIEFVRQGLGLAGRPRGGPPYDDLDHLAGTWTQEEADEFAQRTAAFETVDEDLWR